MLARLAAGRAAHPSAARILPLRAATAPTAAFSSSAQYAAAIKPTSIALAANPQSGKPASDNWKVCSQKDELV